MSRLTDNDHNLGPFTVARWKGNITAEWISHDDEHKWNQLRFIAFGWCLNILMPRILQPWRIKHYANWDAKTVTRLGRNWYFEEHRRVLGFSVCDMGNGYDFVQVMFGAQTHDSRTTMNWCKHLPWKQWKHVRHTIYLPDGSSFAHEGKRKWEDWHELRDQCPRVHFGFEDYDGEMIVASCRIEEREWHKGTGWFRWLKYFSKPRIRRSLDLEFSAEVGTGKGSWKGGTTGHGIEMVRGDTPETAFRRYCELDHSRKGRHFKLRFIGPCNAPPPKPKFQQAAESGSIK